MANSQLPNTLPSLASLPGFPERVDTVTRSIGDIVISESAVDTGEWLECDAKLYNQADFPELFAVTGLIDPFNPLNGYGTNIVVPAPAGEPTGACLWEDPDDINADKYYGVSHGSSIFVTFYRVSADWQTWTKLADPASLPPTTTNDIACSPNGVFWTLAHATSPFITTYSRSGDVFTKIADLSTLPPSTRRAVAYSPDGVWLMTGGNSSPFYSFYLVNDGAFDFANQPTQQGTRVDALSFFTGKHSCVY